MSKIDEKKSKPEDRSPMATMKKTREEERDCVIRLCAIIRKENVGSVMICTFDERKPVYAWGCYFLCHPITFSV